LGDTQVKTLAHCTRRGKQMLQSGGAPGSARAHTRTSCSHTSDKGGCRAAAEPGSCFKRQGGPCRQLAGRRMLDMVQDECKHSETAQ